jgi:hypothetical protein
VEGKLWHWVFGCLASLRMAEQVVTQETSWC